MSPTGLPGRSEVHSEMILVLSRVRSRKARKGRNPQTGDVIRIKASKTVGFKPAPDLKKGL